MYVITLACWNIDLNNKSNSVRSFFKTIVLVMLLGVLHGIVILPVLLTMFNSKSTAGIHFWIPKRKIRYVLYCGLHKFNCSEQRREDVIIPMEISAPLPKAENSNNMLMNFGISNDLLGFGWAFPNPPASRAEMTLDQNDNGSRRSSSWNSTASTSSPHSLYEI